ncbi:hypothetical protein D3C71_2222710 [compost metagenome]
MEAVLACWLGKPGRTQADLLEAAAQARRDAQAESNQQRQSLLASQRPMRRRAANLTSNPENV